MLQIKVINTEDALYPNDAQWNNLLQKSECNSPFLTWEWIYTWWKTLKNKDEDLLIICLTRETGELVAVAPLLIKNKRHFGTTLKIIEFIGGDEGTSVDYLDLIVHPGLVDDVIRRLLDYFTKQEHSNWDIIKMSGILKDSVGFKLCEYFAHQGYQVYEELIDVCPYISLPATWEEYLSTLSKKSRYNIRKKRRILDAAHKNRFYIISDARALEGAMESSVQLHKKRMEMKRIKSFSTTDKFWAFQLEVAKKFFKQQRLFLGIMEVNGSPVASQYGFSIDNKIFHYQTGFDPHYHKYSLGLVSIGHMIENAIKGGFGEYDFLRGKEDYKFHWTKNQREIFSTYIVNKNYKGRFFSAKQKLLKKLKNSAKQLLQ